MEKWRKTERRPVNASAWWAAGWCTGTATTMERERGVALQWRTGDRDVDVGTHPHTHTHLHTHGCAINHQTDSHDLGSQQQQRRPWNTRVASVSERLGAKLVPEYLFQCSAPQVVPMVSSWALYLLKDVRGGIKVREKKLNEIEARKKWRNLFEFPQNPSINKIWLNNRQKQQDKTDKKNI